MNKPDMLARLLAQAETEGGDLATLRAVVEEACQSGADRALRELGLADADARQDLSDLRELLQAWRDAKASAWKAAVDWLVRGCLALLLMGIAWRIGLPELLK